MDKIESLMAVTAAASLLFLAGLVTEASAVLASLGAADFFQALSISNTDKINLALLVTVGLSASLLSVSGGFSLRSGLVVRGRTTLYATGFTAVALLALPLMLSYPYSITGTAGAIVALGLTGWAIQGARGLPAGAGERLFTPVEIAYVAVFSALTAVVTGTTGLALPSPTGGYTNIGDTVIFLSALLFGGKVGGTVGIIGPVVADLIVGYPRWFVTVLAHGSEGFIAGLGRGRGLAAQIIILAVSGFAMATTYFVVNVFIKGYPVAMVSYARDLFGQALVSIILALILTKAVERALPSLRSGVKK